MKNFLSQTELHWDYALKQGLGNPYRLHQWIWHALPDDPEARRDFLFRSDVRDGMLRILLLSSRKPEPSLEATWRTTEMSPTFLGHGVYQFRLRANPTFRRASDHRRLAIFAEPDVHEWFKRKFAQAGCQLLSLETTPPRRITFHKDAHQGTLCAVDANGVLKVTDETLFRTAFDAGFGPAKGFGFGLLLLQPIQP